VSAFENEVEFPQDTVSQEVHEGSSGEGGIEMNFAKSSRVVTLILVFGTLVMSACASTKGSYTVATPPKDASDQP
jgi:hypothetical protein